MAGLRLATAIVQVSRTGLGKARFRGLARFDLAFSLAVYDLVWLPKQRAGTSA
jgi:hypothetical protein